MIKPEQLPIGAKLTRIVHARPYDMPIVDVLTITARSAIELAFDTDCGAVFRLSHWRGGELYPDRFNDRSCTRVRLFRPSDLALIEKIKLAREAWLSVDMPIGWLLLSDKTLRAIIGERKQSHERLVAIQKELKE